MDAKPRILILEDRQADAELMVRELRRAGYEPEWIRVETEWDYVAQLDRGWEIILADYHLPQFDGLRALEVLSARGLDIPFILVSATIGEDKAVEAMKAGASDYVMKDKLARLAPAVTRELREAAERRERRRAETALAKSEAKYRALFESSRDAIMTLFPPDWKFTGANSATIELFDAKDMREFTSLGPADVSPERQPDGRLSSVTAQQMIATAMEHGSHSFEWTYQRITGEVFPSIVLLAHVELDGNTGLQATVRDITERKAAEAEREKLQKQSLQSQKLESIGRLAGGVAHDFNNMLTVILGHVDLLLKRTDPSEASHAELDEIRKAACRSADLTRQLLAFARRQTIAPRVLNLNDTVGGTISMLRHLIGEDIDLNWKPGSNLWPVEVDPSQLDQIVANLSVNARDAIAGVGSIVIQTENVTLDAAGVASRPGLVAGDHVRLTVRDDGCGMDQETLSHVFEPFFTTKAVGLGVGLGMATVYGIVKQNHWWIDVSSDVGKGTTIEIYLPRTVQDADTRGYRPVETAKRGSETVLLVEDEQAVLNLTKAMLEHLGYTILATRHPQEALRLVLASPDTIDLLITDVVMPGMNGLELAERIAVLKPGIRSLFMSGYTADIIADRGVLPEGVRFIQKPFSVRDLALKVREALDASVSAPDSSAGPRPRGGGRS